MSKQFWFVIEGDNGAGKDTLADWLVGDGWFLASQASQAAAEGRRANGLSGMNRVNAFLSYNRICGELAAAKSRSFLVRYWPSTLAAAFADGVLNWDEIEPRIDLLLHQFPAPAMVMFLKCELNARRSRVEGRTPVDGAVDDLSGERDQRYREVIERLSAYPRIGMWRTLDTTKLNAEEVREAALSVLVQMEAKP